MWIYALCTLPPRAPLGTVFRSHVLRGAKDGEAGRVCSYCADDCHSCATSARCLECNSSMYLDESFKCAALSPSPRTWRVRCERLPQRLLWAGGE